MHVQHVMLHSFSFVTSEITFITGKWFNSMLLHHVKSKIGRLSRLVVAKVTRKFYTHALNVEKDITLKEFCRVTKGGMKMHQFHVKFVE